ncbi:hypothetical protein [Puniceicoccus vermicola]|uniref:Uncharacterized protein n=1 Tax=Puniceicoccus vermicola TaxID=388746 RepID=A0A7X1AWD5_9BACT|nr:hypothetical protein [Puniceicoccus vermicola]MBC2601124.1 hypothetical protein [Puniceicoccus vermicola]
MNSQRPDIKFPVILLAVLGVLVLAELGTGGAFLGYFSEFSRKKQNTSDPDSRDIRLIDQEWRTLDCTLPGKREPMILVRRKPDQQDYLVDMSTLSAETQEELGKIRDFNRDGMTEELFVLARSEVTVYLYHIPEMKFFHSPRPNDHQNTQMGRRLELFRAFVKDLDLKYVEKQVELRPLGNYRYILPEGISQVPYLQVGESLFYDQNTSPLKEAIISEFLARK